MDGKAQRRGEVEGKRKPCAAGGACASGGGADPIHIRGAVRVAVSFCSGCCCLRVGSAGYARSPGTSSPR